MAKTKNYRKTKILATLGPSSQSAKKILELSRSGVNAFRLNCSHLDEISIKNYVRKIRLTEKKIKKPIGILLDLQGPKIRIGEIKSSKAMLKKDQDFVLDKTNSPGSRNRVYLSHNEVFSSIKKDDLLLIDDGKIHLKVKKISNNEIRTKVVREGLLKSRKGINFPDSVIKKSALTSADRKNVILATELKIDWIALSFVQNPKDIKDLRKICGEEISIMAKIEKPNALNSIEEITKISDGLMIARGDLGVELPIQNVPGWQKRIIREARIQGKPVVVSTQMLESMTNSLTPTRAEVSDVATAVFEGADAIMLSAESAIGSFPEATVAMMNDIALSVESDPDYNSMLSAQLEETPDTIPDAIATATRTLAEELSSPIIICYTESGSTGIKLSRVRPKQLILTVTPIIGTARKLSLVWGVDCVLQKDANHLDDMIRKTKILARKKYMVKKGDKLVVTAGVPLKVPGTTNLIRVIII